MQFGQHNDEDLKRDAERHRRQVLEGGGAACKLWRLELLRELAAVRGESLLDLTLSGAGDADLAKLAGFRRLKKLDVSERSGDITDAGLRSLAALSALTEVVLPDPASNYHITAKGVAALRSALPACRITGGPPPARPWWRFW